MGEDKKLQRFQNIYFHIYPYHFMGVVGMLQEYDYNNTTEGLRKRDERYNPHTPRDIK